MGKNNEKLAFNRAAAEIRLTFDIVGFISNKEAAKNVKAAIQKQADEISKTLPLFVGNFKNAGLTRRTITISTSDWRNDGSMSFSDWSKTVRSAAQKIVSSVKNVEGVRLIEYKGEIIDRGSGSQIKIPFEIKV